MQSSSFGIVGILFLFLAPKAFGLQAFNAIIDKEKARSPYKRKTRFLIFDFTQIRKA
jgi:hypothetical protein